MMFSQLQRYRYGRQYKNIFRQPYLLATKVVYANFCNFDCNDLFVVDSELWTVELLMVSELISKIGSNTKRSKM